MIKLGIGGSLYGQAWDHKGRTELVQIFIWCDDYVIKSLQFLYAEKGKLVLSDRPESGYIGNKFITVTLQYPDEFLISLKGTYYYDSSGYRKLTSIEFGTHLDRHGPFGQVHQGDEYFDFQMGNHRPFAGFHGTTLSSGLESIGVYFKPIVSLSKLNSDQQVKVLKCASTPK